MNESLVALSQQAYPPNPLTPPPKRTNNASNKIINLCVVTA